MSRIEFPKELRPVLESSTFFVSVAKVRDRAAILVKAPAEELEGFRDAPIRHRFELARYEQGPVLCMVLEVLADPNHPFGLETFFDVGQRQDRALAWDLVNQATLVVYFVDQDLNYTFSRRLRHRPKQRERLRRLIGQARSHLESVDRPDWKAARERFLREVER